MLCRLYAGRAKKKFLLPGRSLSAGNPRFQRTNYKLTAADALSHEPGFTPGRTCAFSRGENPFYRMAQQKLPEL